jgi:hypothetical protein
MSGTCFLGLAPNAALAYTTSEVILAIHESIDSESELLFTGMTALLASEEHLSAAISMIEILSISLEDKAELRLEADMAWRIHVNLLQIAETNQVVHQEMARFLGVGK